MRTRPQIVCRFFTQCALSVLLVAGLFSWIPGSVLAQDGNRGGDDGVVIDPIIIAPCPTLSVEDIREAGATHQDLKVNYPWWLNVDVDSLGDGDVVVAGPDGYLQRGKLISVAIADRPFPVPLDPIPNRSADGLIALPQPGPIVIATYRILPPEPADTWLPEHNGGYRVSLLEGQVTTTGGDALPGKLLGGFRVAIRDGGEPTPIQPVETRIHVGNQPGVGLFAGEPDPNSYFGTVQLFFNTPHVEVEFLELVRERNTFVANVRAVKLPLSDPDPVPVPLAGTPRDANGVEGDPDRPIVIGVHTNVYPLGELINGDYRFVVRVNGEREGVEEFLVGDEPGDEQPPEAALRARNITMASDSPQRLEVVYEDPSGVDITTIGDGDIMVLSPCLFLDVEPPFPCDWEAQRARLVDVVTNSNNLRRVVAIYEIDPPQGGWTHEHNGFYPVVWRAGEVCDRLENCNREARLGGFEVAIRPGGDPVPAEAEIDVDASDPDMVVAKVHVDFRGHWAVVGQDITRDGNRIILEARAEQLAAPANLLPPSEDLLYEIGPLREGGYVAVFRMNGHIYDVQEFRVQRPVDPPIPAEVEMEIDASDSDNVIAVVKIQFRTHHRVEQGEVIVDGHRIQLPARAEPLPVRLAGPDVIPEPVLLRYQIGALPAGSYLAAFVMNEFPYAAERIVIDDPQPPIPAEVHMEVITDDPSAVVARVKVKFETPHAIEERDVHREGNRFMLTATARPTRPAEDPNDPDRNTIVLEYPLGELGAGNYGAAFVMNGFQYANEAFQIRIRDEFEAEVALGMDAGDPTDVKAKATILFENRYVVIQNPGTPRRDGNQVIIDATAVVATFVREPEHNPIDLSYDLGAFRPGEYVLIYKINGQAEARALFRVDEEPPIPAEARLAVEVDGSAADAHAKIQFRDHYRIVGRELTRQGTRFIIDLEVEGPLPILAPIPPPPVELEIPLGENIADGSYIAGLRMNGFLYAFDHFQVHLDPFAVEVDLAVDVSATGGAVAKAVVDFRNPFVVITDPGEVVRNGDVFEIRATAEEVVFIQEPSGDPQTLRYDLGSPDPGRYGVVYYINGRPEAHTRFEVEGEPEPPIANIAGIEIAQGNASWFAEVGVILLPGQQVTDWGVVRQSQNEFHVNIAVDWVDFPNVPNPEPIDPRLVPDGVVLVDPAGGDALIGDAPVRLVRNTYNLGVLDHGEYVFFVHSRGQTVARKGFEVLGHGPSAELRVENITEPKDRPHRFSINYSDPEGLDHESIQEAAVAVAGPDGFERRAVLEGYASTDDVPSTGATAIYTVEAPGGSWDPRDNGRYCVHVDPEAVRDLNGNTLANGRLGCFHARMIIDPPSGDAEVRVDVAMVEGEWFANVEIIPARGTAIEVDNWGQVLHHGHTILALATVTQSSTPNGPIAEPLAHRYPLGALRPGGYVFVFKTNLAHCGFERFRVPGMEGDPIDNWRDANRVRDGVDDGDRNDILAEYFFALDPNRPDLPFIHPEIVEDEDGGHHLAIRYRRLLAADGVRQVIEVSRDMRRWVEADGMTEIVEQDVNIDGTEERLVCLRERLGDNSFRWMRIRLVGE